MLHRSADPSLFATFGRLAYFLLLCTLKYQPVMGMTIPLQKAI
jgi:hypothetical protein